MYFTFHDSRADGWLCFYVGQLHQCFETNILVSHVDVYTHVGTYRVSHFAHTLKVTAVTRMKIKEDRSVQMASLYDYHIVPWKEVEYGT